MKHSRSGLPVMLEFIQNVPAKDTAAPGAGLVTGGKWPSEKFWSSGV